MRSPAVCVSILALALVVSGVFPGQGVASGDAADQGPIAATPVAAAAPAAAAPASANGGDVAAGKLVFRRSCRACHQADQGGAGTAGPNLWAVLGRPVAAESGFEYSEALQAMGKKGAHWDAKTLDGFLAQPSTVAPGTSMPLGTPNATARRDLIAYLATLTP